MNVITTCSGGTLNLDDPLASEVSLLDIARGLSNKHVDTKYQKFFSIAQRNVVASKMVPPDLALYTLMYEASLGYVLQHNSVLDTAICASFGIPTLLEVDRYNKVLSALGDVCCNARKLTSRGAAFWTPEKSYQMFLERYLELTD